MTKFIGLGALALLGSLAFSSIAYADDTAPPLPAPLPSSSAQPAAPAPTIPSGIEGAQGAPAAPIVMAPANTTVELQRMRLVLRELSSGDADYRLVGGIAGLGLGAVATPIGISMLARSSSKVDDRGTVISGSIVLGAGLGSIIGGILNLSLSFDPSTRVLEAFERRAAAGVPADVNIAETESDWRARAQTAESSRKLGGGLAMGLGVVAMGIGSYFVLGERFSNLDRADQDTRGAVLLVGGLVTVLAGLQSFFWKTTVESSWQTYRGVKGLARNTLLRPKVDVTPLPGGGAISLSSLF
ncbi:MAG: hypothetical protein U0174_26730 [Polyangiaceae bacterium]